MLLFLECLLGNLGRLTSICQLKSVLILVQSWQPYFHTPKRCLLHLQMNSKEGDM